MERKEAMEWLRLYGSYLRAERKYDLLINVSILLSVFWLVLFVGPWLPFSTDLPTIGRLVQLEQIGFFWFFSVGHVFLLLTPFLLGLLYFFSEKYEEENQQAPRSFTQYAYGVVVSIEYFLEYDEKKTLGHVLRSKFISFVIFSLFTAFRGWVLMFRWVVLSSLLLASNVLEKLWRLVGKKRYELFALQGSVKNVDELVAFLVSRMEGEIVARDAIRFDSDLPESEYVFRLCVRYALGPMVLVESEKIKMIVSKSGVSISGETRALRKYALEIYPLVRGFLVETRSKRARMIEEKLGRELIARHAFDEKIPLPELLLLMSKAHSLKDEKKSRMSLLKFWKND